jgi:hypothetical protein
MRKSCAVSSLKRILPDTLDEHTCLLRLHAAESGNFPEMAQWFYVTVVRRVNRALIGIVESGIERGDFRPIQPEIIANAFVAPLAFFTLRDVWGQHAPPSQFLEGAFEMLIGGLCDVPHDT